MTWNDWEWRDEGAPEWLTKLWWTLIPLNIIVWGWLSLLPDDRELSPPSYDSPFTQTLACPATVPG